jgi:hypothetical protein
MYKRAVHTISKDNKNKPGITVTNFFLLLTAALCLTLGIGCSKSSSPNTTIDPIIEGTVVTLDSAGIVQSTITVDGTNGSELTLYAGTQIMVIANQADSAVAASGSSIQISLTDAKQNTANLPSGITSFLRFRIRLTIAGKETDAVFWTPTDSANASTKNKGLKLVIQVDTSIIDIGTLCQFYQISASGIPMLAGTSGVTGTPGTLLSKIRYQANAASGGNSQATFNPTSTGDYAAGGASANQSTVSVPDGCFWNTYAVPCPSSITIAGSTTVLHGTSTIDRIAIVEESTAEEMAMCQFSSGDVSASDIVSPGYQFFAKRSHDSASSTMPVTLYCNQANIPTIHVYGILRTAGGNNCPWEVYVRTTGGVTSPDGTVYSDPYQKPELKFTGFKNLIFVGNKDKNYGWMKKNALQPLLDAGYSARIFTFKKSATESVADVDVYNTLDGRAQMVEDILKKLGWKVRKDNTATKGNKCTLDYAGKLSIVTAFGISVIPDYRIMNEAPVNGTVTVKHDDSTIYNATVTVNGVPVSLSSSGYDLANSGVSINPGDSIKIIASLSNPTLSDTVSVQCPPSFQITNPADGSPNNVSPLTVTWSPAIAIVPSFTFTPAPVAGQYASGASNGTYGLVGTGDQFKNLVVGQTEVTLTAVDTTGDFSIIEVRTSSELVSKDRNIAICYLHKRVRLVKP